MGVVGVAYSGGRDSTALLHATLAAAEPLGLRVVALHVHHGLSSEADAWLEHCAERCRRWAARGRPLGFAARCLASRPGVGDSVEAWARRERYRALAEMAQAAGSDLVLLAHHRRDQAETFVLQSLRGGGVAGLAAMPRAAVREGLTWARPWIDTPAEEIGAYARRHRLSWVEDDSNADQRFARNRLRASVWPALVAAFPDAELALARAAAWAQQAMAVVDETAASDLLEVAADGHLQVDRWRELPAPRRSHALRAWLRARCGETAPPSLVERLLSELEGAAARRWPAPGGELHAYRGRLVFEPTRQALAPEAAALVDLSRPGLHEVTSWQGAFRVERVESGGLRAVAARSLELRARRPGDRFQAGAGRPPRSLKLQFQAAGVPARQRGGPVVCSEDAIVYVSGLGIDARALAAPGEVQVALTWVPA